MPLVATDEPFPISAMLNARDSIRRRAECRRRQARFASAQVEMRGRTEKVARYHRSLCGD